MANLLIADDHALVRDTIAAFLQNVEDFHVSTADSFPAAMTLMSSRESFDLLVLDYNMPGMQGIRGIEIAGQKHPETKVVLMSGVASRDAANSAMASGAYGFFPKSLTPASFVSAIRVVLSGERYFPFSLDDWKNNQPEDETFASLSDRERQTLEQLSIGLSNKEIARNLDIQEVTVKLHVKNVLSKLGVANRTQAALLAKERHFI